MRSPRGEVARSQSPAVSARLSTPSAKSRLSSSRRSHTTTGPVRLTGEIVWVDRSGSAGPLYPPPVYEVFGETVWLDLPERRTPEEPPIRHGMQFSNLETATVVTLLSCAIRAPDTYGLTHA